MNPLAHAIQDYLALRRSLGFKLRDAGIYLSKFAAFLEARGATHITTQLALEWAQQSPSAQLQPGHSALAMSAASRAIM